MIMKELTYQEVRKEWGNSRYKRVSYKGKELKITAFQEVRNFPLPAFDRVFYIGEFNCLEYKTIESIHYDKVVSRFQRFVDEYCTDWVEFKQFRYKDYVIDIMQEKGKEFYIGYVYFHKNSIYRYIANNIEEVVRCCKSRIDRVMEEKEKIQRKALTPKQEKIQELEQLQARISAQLEELKKEKETYIYKGVVLEYGVEEETRIGYLIGRIKDAPKSVDYLYGTEVDTLKNHFEKYIDDLEKSANIYHQLMKKYIR